jgi:hypothetical protein
LDAYGGVWLLTANNNYLTGSEFSKHQNTLTQDPVGVVEMHLSYSVTPRFWASVGGNYRSGGANNRQRGIEKCHLQSNSRIGATVSIPLTKRRSLKFSYNDGELARVGGTRQTLSFAWQYSWLGRPK